MQSFLRLACILLLTTLSLPAFAAEKGDALLEYRKGNYAKAVDFCIAELADAPTNMDAHVVLCWSLVALSRYDEAARYGSRALGVNRYDPRIVEILGEAYYHQGRNEDALRLFQDYVTLSPEGSRIDMVYYLTGELYIRLGRFRHADIALSTAVRYVSGDAVWWTRLAYAREQSGEYRHALEAYEQALHLNPQSVDAQSGLERTRQSLPSR